MKKDVHNLALFAISIASIAFVVGCDYSYEAKVQQFQKEIRRTIDPIKLQDWALPQINSHTNGYSFSLEELPDYVKIANGPTRAFISADPDGNKLLYLAWGKGFGQRGIIVGDANYIRNPWIHEILSLWKPGVYLESTEQH